MSLALIAVHDRHAFIVSDGAVTALRFNGSTSRWKSDYPKFAVFSGGIAIAATNDMWMNEQLYCSVAGFMAAAPGATLVDVVDHVAATLPMLRRQVDERDPGLPPVPDGSKYSSPAVVGFDATADRARIFWFDFQDETCTPNEHAFVVIGKHWDIAGPMLDAAYAQASVQGSFAAMPSTMQRIVREFSGIRDVIGGNLYTCSIGPDRTAKVECRRELVTRTCETGPGRTATVVERSELAAAVHRYLVA